MSESSEEELKERLGWAGLAILGLMTSLALLGLLTRIWLTSRLARAAAHRRLSVSTASSCGGFESFSPPPAAPAAQLLWPDLYSSPASTGSYHLDQRSAGETLNTTYDNIINCITSINYFLKFSWRRSATLLLGDRGKVGG